MIDTNIILDVLLKREPFYTQSRTVLDLCEKRQISGFVSASSVTDIFYLIRRTLHDTEVTYKAIDLLLNIVGILDVTAEDVYSAFAKQAKDFEDCLLAECAKSNKCVGIVTRNNKDFQGFDIDVYSPEEVVLLNA